MTLYAASRRTVESEGVDAFLTRVCEGKSAYANAAHAYHAKEKTMRKTSDRLRSGLGGTEPYRCPYCGNVHLGHRE